MAGLECGDRFGDRGRFGQREEVRRHDRAGRARLVSEKRIDARRLRALPRDEDAVRAVFRDLFEDVDGVIGIEVIEQLGDLEVVKLTQDASLYLGDRLRERLGFSFDVLNEFKELKDLWVADLAQ